jgi:peptide/nickel transport system permease protein
MCGYFGGIFDLLMQRFVDAWMCIPSLILMMVIISIIGPGIWQVTIVMGLCFGISGSRIVRSAAMSIKENVYLQAERAIGCSPNRIITRHILPNIMAALIILFSTVVPMVILVEASLSFLGYGVPPPNPSWGAMLSGSARDYMFQAPWIIIWPGLALSVVVYSVNMLGDALRDLLDPRLRGGVGRYGVRVKKSFLTSGSNTSKQNIRKG